MIDKGSRAKDGELEALKLKMCFLTKWKSIWIYISTIEKEGKRKKWKKRGKEEHKKVEREGGRRDEEIQIVL